MSDGQLRIAVAEARGWQRREIGDAGIYGWLAPGGKHRPGAWRTYYNSSELPNFPASLDAIHEAIDAQPNDVQWAIFASLAAIVDPEKPAAFGSAREYCRAFLTQVAPAKLK